MKLLLHAIFIILIALVTFFGLGPVLLTDGVWQERIFTGAVVLVLYFVIIFLYRKSLNCANKK